MLTADERESSYSDWGVRKNEEHNRVICGLSNFCSVAVIGVQSVATFLCVYELRARFQNWRKYDSGGRAGGRFTQ